MKVWLAWALTMDGEPRLLDVCRTLNGAQFSCSNEEMSLNGFARTAHSKTTMMMHWDRYPEDVWEAEGGRNDYRCVEVEVEA